MFDGSNIAAKTGRHPAEGPAILEKSYGLRPVSSSHVGLDGTQWRGIRIG